jgi:hypothetical protein
MDIDKTLTGGSGVGDIRSGEERAAFTVDYVLDPNIPAKPPVADNAEDPIRDANGNYIFTKGENGKYQFVFTDSEGHEHSLETDEDDLKNEFDKTIKLSNSELNNYPFKKMQLFVLRTDNNKYKISTVYNQNGTDRGVAPEIVWDIKQTKEIDVSFNSEREETIYIYYTNKNLTFPVYAVELIRVIPNIAWKQGNTTDYIPKTNEKTHTLTHEIELSGSAVSLRPLFLTKQEQNSEITYAEALPLLERNPYCYSLVDSIQWNGQRYDAENTLDWVEYPIKTKNSVYEIVAGGTSTKGFVKAADSSPPVTVTRSISNEETGYYIEDYYSTAMGGISDPPSLRDKNNTMKGGGFEVLGADYKIPIVHYNNPCSVKLLLTDIPRNMNPSPLQYIIADRTVALGKEFTLQTPPNDTILDIKDVDGHIRGKIEFRQVTEPSLSPTLNIVTIDTSRMNVGFSTVINDLNAIYNTMNVSWLEGTHFMLDTAFTNEDLKIINGNNGEKAKLSTIDRVLVTLRKQPNYSPNQYYMIVVPELATAGVAPSDLADNWFFVRSSIYRDGNKITPAHELGHCNGLDEFAVNIGAATREDAIKATIQYQSTNVMGYSRPNSSSRHLKDFFSWQIPVIRKRINEQLNKK